MAHKLFGVSEQLLFAIPNGGERNIIVAKRMKDEGVRSGVPDLFLAVSNGDSHGLFIEMKKEKGGVTSASQKEMIGILKEQGFVVVVCRGWAEAKATIENYLKEKRNV